MSDTAPKIRLNTKVCYIVRGRIASGRVKHLNGPHYLSIKEDVTHINLVMPRKACTPIVKVRTYEGKEVIAEVLEEYPEGSGKEGNMLLKVHGERHLYAKARITT